MATSNRREFLRRASVGAVAVGALAAVPELLHSATAQAQPAAPTPTPTALEGPVVVVLNDAAAGQFTVMHGEQSSTFTDPALAARLSRVASTA